LALVNTSFQLNYSESKHKKNRKAKAFSTMRCKISMPSHSLWEKYTLRYSICQ